MITGGSRPEGKLFWIADKILPPGKDKVIAEIGCGTGGNLKLLNEYYQVLVLTSRLASGMQRRG
jgi:hypothetical protein